MRRSVLEELARRTDTTPQDCFSLVEALRDTNPLLGVKGCRFSLLNPEFLAMQVRAVLGAGLEVIREGHKRMGTVQFMIPMISSEHETLAVVSLVQAASEEFFAAQVGGAQHMQDAFPIVVKWCWYQAGRQAGRQETPFT